MCERGQLTSIESAISFFFAGSATVTLESAKTGARFTFKVDAVENQSPTRQPRYFVKLLAGQDNETDYVYMGMLVPNSANLHDYKLMTTRASRVDLTAPSAMALQFALKCFADGRLHSQLRIWHEGRCGRCGRKLTVPESIANGIGPECARQMSL